LAPVPIPDKVLVTGGLGFVGSQLVAELVGLGSEVVIYDNRAPNERRNDLLSKGVSVTKGDVRDRKAVVTAARGTGAVVHLAALTRDEGKSHGASAQSVNVEGTQSVLEACRLADVPKLVFSSSFAVYGNQTPPLRESFAPAPISSYGSSKARAEERCSAYGSRYGLATVSLRLANVYGPGVHLKSDGSVMVRFAEALRRDRRLTVYGDGEQTRDFLHVTDAARAFVLALGKRSRRYEVFNVGTGVQTTINTLASMVLSLGTSGAGVRHVPARPQDIKHSWGDTTKARRWLGFQATVGLEQGVAGFLKWFSGNSA